eukprot:snap_masked-scaffold_16-processed-gene-2.16-mRNA-1 protein AED:1.00 eAED:1.00 QI:0/-1/0/0/-1/1/1/0/301
MNNNSLTFLSAHPIVFSIFGASMGLIGLNSWIHGRKIIFLQRIYANLSRSPSQDFKPGDYVLLEGKIKLEGKALKSPEGNKDCAMYFIEEKHVLEEVKEHKVSANAGFGMFSIIKKVFSLFGFVLEKTFGKRNKLDERLSQFSQSASWRIFESNKKFAVDISEFFSFVEHLKKFSVIDLEEFFQPQVSSSKFIPKPSSSASKLFRTIGFQKIEKVLLEGDSLTVLAEVKQIDSNEISLGSSENKNLLDLKTSRIRPFIVSTFSRRVMKQLIGQKILFLCLKFVSYSGLLLLPSLISIKFVW